MQPAPGGFRWDALDSHMAYLADHGFIFGGLLHANVGWNAKDAPGTLPVRNLDAWGAYVAATVGHCKDRIRRWEVWNEPPNGTGPDQTPADYAKLVVRTYQEAKAADPDCRIGLAAKSAHISYLERAIRAGAKPQEPDNVVQPLATHCVALYGAPTYLAAVGQPVSESALSAHRFVGPVGQASRAPFYRWLTQHVEPDRIVFRSNDDEAQVDAVAAGAGLGFLSLNQARSRGDLVEVMPPRSEWEVQLWLVTHVDLHRTAKVQAFVTALKEDMKGWAVR